MQKRRILALIMALVIVLNMLGGCQPRPSALPSAGALPPSGADGLIIAPDPVEEIFTTTPERPSISDEDFFDEGEDDEFGGEEATLPSADGIPPQEGDGKPRGELEPDEPVSAASSAVPASSMPPASSDIASSSVSGSAPAYSPAAQTSSVPSGVASTAQPATAKTPSTGEIRAVWISYLELGPWLSGRSQSQFTTKVREAFDNCTNFGLNTVIVQVRPFADALYESQYFPWSRFASGTEGASPGFDPLEIMVREAKARGLRIEAWINPYRVSHNVNQNPLSANNQARIWLREGGGHAAQSSNGFVVFNPASKQAQELIINGIREIVRNYDVDGIHIDDYFYPITGTDFDTTFDISSYNAYRNGGGKLSHANWRRQNVDTLIKAMYAAVKQENPKVLFGISPESSLDTNYNRAYFDVEKALSTSGYCDYICPQIYFGFKNEVQPFAQTLDRWDELIKTSGVKLYVGLAVYKSGLQDQWARSGSAEWQNNTNLLTRMVQRSRDAHHYGGFVLYRYDSLFNPASNVKNHVQKEYNNLREIL